MPYPTKLETVSKLLLEYLQSISVVTATGVALKDAGVLVHSSWGQSAISASTALVAKILPKLQRMVSGAHQAEMAEACYRFNEKDSLDITIASLRNVFNHADELKALLKLVPNSDAFCKKYDKRFLNPDMIASHYNISPLLAKALCDPKLRSRSFTEALFVRFVIPIVLSGVVGYLLPISDAWVKDFPTLTTLLASSVGYVLSEAVTGLYDGLQRLGFFGCCSRSPTVNSHPRLDEASLIAHDQERQQITIGESESESESERGYESQERRRLMPPSYFPRNPPKTNDCYDVRMIVGDDSEPDYAAASCFFTDQSGQASSGDESKSGDESLYSKVDFSAKRKDRQKVSQKGMFGIEDGDGESDAASTSSTAASFGSTN